ncbi:MAG TPA: ATP synthase subunit C [Candidatus Atribacteria bacterium]|nr:ATP synthase subunit C [Candidatus Atribacteria bacterium]HPT79188.1 ATP synthase subunit C [Candidatus Atribacteria bacterium]
MYLLLIAAVCVVVLTTAAGLVIRFKGSLGRLTTKKALKLNLSAFVPIMAGAVIMLIPDMASAAETAGASGGNGLGFIAAALSTGLATIGAGYAVGSVASSALGAVSEDPSLLGKTLIFVGLAEGIAIYGLIISIMILGAL